MNVKEGVTMFQLTQTDKQALYNDDAEYFTDKGARAYSREEYREAVEYYRIAATLGETQAIANLGYCYLYGRAIERNIDLAIAYFEIAASMGNIDALYKLGSIFQSDKWGYKDNERAIFYFQNAIFEVLGSKEYDVDDIKNEDFLLNYPSLCLTLGQAHMKDDILQTNLKIAYVFLEKAKEGYEEALANNIKRYEVAYHRTLELLNDPEFLG